MLIEYIVDIWLRTAKNGPVAEFGTSRAFGETDGRTTAPRTRHAENAFHRLRLSLLLYQDSPRRSYHLGSAADPRRARTAAKSEWRSLSCRWSRLTKALIASVSACAEYS